MPSSFGKKAAMLGWYVRLREEVDEDAASVIVVLVLLCEPLRSACCVVCGVFRIFSSTDKYWIADFYLEAMEEHDA